MDLAIIVVVGIEGVFIPCRTILIVNSVKGTQRIPIRPTASQNADFASRNHRRLNRMANGTTNGMTHAFPFVRIAALQSSPNTIPSFIPELASKRIHAKTLRKLNRANGISAIVMAACS